MKPKPLRATLQQMDLVLPCPARGCGAKADQACARGVTHFARRLQWLLKTVHARAKGELVVR
jgi:hypothetical protein